MKYFSFACDLDYYEKRAYIDGTEDVGPWTTERIFVDLPITWSGNNFTCYYVDKETSYLLYFYQNNPESTFEITGSVDPEGKTLLSLEFKKYTYEWKNSVRYGLFGDGSYADKEDERFSLSCANIPFKHSWTDRVRYWTDPSIRSIESYSYVTPVIELSDSNVHDVSFVYEDIYDSDFQPSDPDKREIVIHTVSRALELIKYKIGVRFSSEPYRFKYSEGVDFNELDEW